MSDEEQKKADLNSAKVDVEHKYFLLAIELQRVQIELSKLLGVVTEFQEQLAVDAEDSGLILLPPGAVVDMYVKTIHRIVSELNETNFDEIDLCDVDGESHAAKVVALQRENECLRQRVDGIQCEKANLEEQFTAVEELIVLARDLKDENEGLICDFRSLKDSIAVERANDAVEIVELTKSFRQLIADNALLRRRNDDLESRIRHLHPASDDAIRSTSFGERQEQTDIAAECSQALNKSPFSLVVVDSSEASSGDKIQKSESREEVEWNLSENSASVCHRETQTETDVQLQATAAVSHLKTLEDEDTDDIVAELMTDVRRKDEEIIGRMHEIKMTSTTDVDREHICRSVERIEHQKLVVSQRPTLTMKPEETVDGRALSGAGREKCSTERAKLKSEEFPLLECESVSAAKSTSRQTSTDSAVRDQENHLGDSGLQRSFNLQPSELANMELDGLSTAWEQLFAENYQLRVELAKLTAASVSERNSCEDQDENEDDSGRIGALRRHAAHLESEVAALKSTVREQGVCVDCRGVHPDDPDNQSSPWALPYDHASLTTGVNGEEVSKIRENDDDGEGTTRDSLSENALLKEELESMKLKLKWYEVSADETRHQLEEEVTRLRDQQSTILTELAAKTKQIEDLEVFQTSHQTALQRTSDEVAESCWSVLDEMDSRRTRLNDEISVMNGERTMQSFAVRLESWLRDYETLIGQRDSRRLNDLVTVDSVDTEKSLNGQTTTDSFVTNMDQLGNEVNEKEIELETDVDEAGLPRVQTHLHQANPTSYVLAAYLEQLQAEIEAKDEELRSKNGWIENEALQSAALSNDYKEQLVSEIELLTFDRSMLHQRLQEAQFEAEETREELSTENSRLRSQLEAVKQRAEDERASAAKNAETLATENRRLCDELSKMENDRRLGEESHQTQLSESAERLRAIEENLATDNRKLKNELAAVSAERGRLQENCAKLENDCLAFQELSSEMVERCERLSIELERLKQSSSGSGIHHDDCRRVAEQARREIQSLKDENCRLAMILEMERLKNFRDEERPATTDRQTDTADFGLRNGLQSALSNEFGVREDHPYASRNDSGRDGRMTSVLGSAQAARAATLHVRHLLKSRCLEVDEGQLTCRTAEADKEASTDQLAGVVDKLAAELDALVKSLTSSGPETVRHPMTGPTTNGNNCVGQTPDNDSPQSRELQHVLQV